VVRLPRLAERHVLLQQYLISSRLMALLSSPALFRGTLTARTSRRPEAGQSTNNVFDSNVYFGNLQPPTDAYALQTDPRSVAAGQGRIGRETLAGYRGASDSLPRTGGGQN
jgi:hypothetical protein